MDESKSCPKCHAKMDEGFVVDDQLFAQKQSEWAQGEPSYSFSGLKNRLKLPITAFCCQLCGYIESYGRRQAAP
jgi:predicted nucleic-acid-binding Zn-ribbon protein